MRENVIKLVIHEISRIEGHLDVEIVISGGGVVRAFAKALEGSRIIENVLVGKNYWEAIEIASRMCGVCHVIHKLTATQAIENAFGIIIPEDAAMLREVLCIAGHIQSHLTHLYYFSLPDFYGKDSIFELMRDNRELVLRLIKLRQLTVDVTKRIGGSQVHPITPIVGGLSRNIKKSDVISIINKFNEMKKYVVDIAKAILELEIPQFSRKTNYIALRGSKSIPLLRGKVGVFDEGDYDFNAFMKSIEKIPEKYSNAPHYLYKSRNYMVGALSRLNINYPNLISEARDLCKLYNTRFPSYNPFMNNTAQAIEIVHYVYKGLEILEKLLGKKYYVSKTNYKVREGIGISVSEAPRGLLIHQYSVNKNGKITNANIITPTAQNLKNLESDCVEYYKLISNEPQGVLRKKIEMLIRSYDPCISCAARFKKLDK